MLAWAKPERFATFTNAPEDWQALRQKQRTLTLKLRREGYSWESAWTVERGSKTGMKHVHALQHGSFVPQKLLQEAWGAIVHIEAIRGARGVANYALKEASRVAGYAVKGTTAQLAEHLALNGGRGCHYSRGYLHGKRLREVEGWLWPGQPELTWIVVDCHESQADVAARCAAI